MCELDGRIAAEPDLFQSLTNRGVVHIAFAHRLRPRSVSLLVSEMEEHDALAVLSDELDGIHPTAEQPIQIWAELDLRESRQGPLEIVLVVLDLIRVVVEVQDDAVLIAKCHDLPEQLDLVVELLWGLGLRRAADGSAQGSAANLREAGDYALRIFEDGSVFLAVPHVPAKGRADHGERVFL